MPLKELRVLELTLTLIQTRLPKNSHIISLFPVLSLLEILLGAIQSHLRDLLALILVILSTLTKVPNERRIMSLLLMVSRDFLGGTSRLRWSLVLILSTHALDHTISLRTLVSETSIFFNWEKVQGPTSIPAARIISPLPREKAVDMGPNTAASEHQLFLYSWTNAIHTSRSLSLLNPFSPCAFRSTSCLPSVTTKNKNW